MASFGGPLLVTVFVWWFFTGAILFLDGLPRRTFKWSRLVATVLTAGAFAALVASAHDTSVLGAYVAFVSAILVWGWNEVAFLLGGMTGSRRTACPPDAAGLRRFILAAQTLSYHEALILASFALVAIVTWNAPNTIALWTFAILWIMRISAKLNIFLGVRNITHEFLPPHLTYLKSYFRIRPMNALLPFSVCLGSLAATMLALRSVEASPAGFEAAGLALLATLTGLAVLEHIFMILPLPFGQLWSWAMRGRERALPCRERIDG